MGEKRTKSRHRAQILADNPRCIYCIEAADTVEHMPPTWMFQRSFRLSGMEYPSCKACNEGTRAADLAAGWFARLRPFEGDLQDPHWLEAQQREASLRLRAPGLLEEVFDSSPSTEGWLRGPRGLLEPVVQIRANGPIFAAHMLVFGAKLGMALFAEHAGRPLPSDGRVYVQPYMNGGLSQEAADAALSILPAFGALKQGRLTSTDQFAYRFNSDEKSIVAALVGFHNNLHFLVFGVAQTELYDRTLKPSTAGSFAPGSLVQALRQPASMFSARTQQQLSLKSRGSLLSF